MSCNNFCLLTNKTTDGAGPSRQASSAVYILALFGTLDGAAVAVEASCDNGVNWMPVATLSAVGLTQIAVPPACLLRATVSSAGGSTDITLQGFYSSDLRASFNAAAASSSVSIASPLPAGTNNIGDVDIASPLPAGTNNIGDVDLASPIPAGTNNIGDVDVVSMPSIPAGSNSIGEVVVNPGSTMAYGNFTCSGSAVVLVGSATVPKNGIVMVSAHPDNDEEIYIADASAADEVGLSIAPGATVPIPTDDVNKLYQRGKTTTCKGSWYCNK